MRRAHRRVRQAPARRCRERRRRRSPRSERGDEERDQVRDPVRPSAATESMRHEEGGGEERDVRDPRCRRERQERARKEGTSSATAFRKHGERRHDVSRAALAQERGPGTGSTAAGRAARRISAREPAGGSAGPGAGGSPACGTIASTGVGSSATAWWKRTRDHVSGTAPPSCGRR